MGPETESGGGNESPVLQKRARMGNGEKGKGKYDMARRKRNNLNREPQAEQPPEKIRFSSPLGAES